MIGLSFAVLAGLTADALYGEPRARHPLIAFGRWAGWLERRGYADRVAAGARSAAVAVGLPVIGLVWLTASLPGPLAWAVVATLLYLAIGRHALAAHARPVAAALAAEDLAAARHAVGRLVSRDAQAMDTLAIRRATIESVLENSSDAIIAPVLWAGLGALVAGPAGAAGAVTAHRLVNTLDAMWGYRTPRYAHFGRAAARADDVLNWPAAQLTAWTFVLLGHRRRAWQCWRRQAAACDSPNAGPVMTAGAGALGVTLGGPAIYHGRPKDKAVIGCGDLPAAGDIERALSLVDRSVAVIAALVMLLGLA